MDVTRLKEPNIRSLEILVLSVWVNIVDGRDYSAVSLTWHPIYDRKRLTMLNYPPLLVDADAHYPSFV